VVLIGAGQLLVRDHAMDMRVEVAELAYPVAAYGVLGAHERAPHRLLLEFGVNLRQRAERPIVLALRAPAAGAWRQLPVLPASNAELVTAGTRYRRLENSLATCHTMTVNIESLTPHPTQQPDTSGAESQ